jgi:AI-2 transport protein TqsA
MQPTRAVVIPLSILAFIAVGAVLALLRPVLLPFALAVFLSFLFKPVLLFCAKKHIPSAVGILLVVLIMAGVLFGLSMIVVSSVDAFIGALPRYADRLNALVAGTTDTARQLAVELGMNPADVRITDAISAGALTEFISSSIGSLFTLLGNGFLILLFLIFILSGSGELSRKFAQAFADEHAERASVVIENIDARVRQYMVTKTLVSLLTGATSAIILTIIGVDFALLWGFLTFLLNFIPNIGSLFGTVFPVTIALLQFDSPARAIIALVLLVLSQNLIGNILEPKIMAFSLNLSPLLILVALMFWGWLWGVMGMILAVPIMSTIKIICEQVESLKPIAIFMSGSVAVVRTR